MADEVSQTYTHVLRFLTGDLGPPGAFALLSTDDSTKRLVVFVHGFMGTAGGTWTDFPGEAAKWTRDPWWKTSDLFFYTYPSVKQSTFYTAQDLYGWLKQLFPSPDRRYFELTGKDIPAGYFDLRYDPVVREVPVKYDEIVLVGHSEGGFVLRRVAVMLMKDKTHGPSFHQAKLRLFAPALFGASPSGFLGVLARAPIIDRVAYALSGWAAAYQDLTNTTLLLSVKSDTESLAGHSKTITALHALIVWGKDETIVGPGEYLTDDSWPAIPGHSHTSICKPKPPFLTPLEFVSA